MPPPPSESMGSPLDRDFRVGEWLVQPPLNTIWAHGKSFRVEPKVMEVLACLARHAGEVVPKEEFIRSVWPNTFVSDDALIRAIAELRKFFGDDPREPHFIQTVAKRGYRLIAPVAWNYEKSAGSQVSGKSHIRGVLARRWVLALGLVGLALVATYAFWYHRRRLKILKYQPILCTVPSAKPLPKLVLPSGLGLVISDKVSLQQFSGGGVSKQPDVAYKIRCRPAV